MNPHQIKNLDAVLKEYDLLLMEANRKAVLLGAAIGELQEENTFLKGEIEKLKPADAAPKASDKK